MVTQFIVLRPAGLDWEEIGRSKSFRWSRASDVPPEKRRTISRLVELGKRLERDGWERSGQGSDWYSYRFRRRLSRSHSSSAPKAATGEIARAR